MSSSIAANSIIAVKYQNFICEIGSLGTSLSRLRDVIEKVERQYPRRAWHSDAHSTHENQSLWLQVTGNFYQTLEECRTLLERHGRLRNGGPNAFANLNWWMSAEGAVDKLMAKLKDHISKVDFCAKPNQFEAIFRQGQDLQQLRRQVANLERRLFHGDEQSTTLWASIVPPELKANLEHAFIAHPPSWYVEGSAWPLKEAFEALIFYFAGGTVKSTLVSTLESIPDVRQFLNLAKSVWICEAIKESQDFKNRGADSIWADYMRELEDDLRGQLNRFETGELVRPSLSELLELPSVSYTISMSQEVDPDTMFPEEAGPSGELLLELDLVSDLSNKETCLSVFRESDTDLLFVISRKQVDALGVARDREVEVNMERHRLVPLYGNPTQGCLQRNNITICNEKGRRTTEYAFRTLADVQKVQQALTGYRVHHEMPLLSWSINGSEQPTQCGTGALQLWQYKPLVGRSPTEPFAASGAEPTPASPGSGEPGMSFSPRAELAGFAASRAQNEACTDFFGWHGFPSIQQRSSAPAPASNARQTRAISSGFVNAKQHSLAVSTGTGVCSDRGLSNASDSARSKSGSSGTRRQSSLVSGTTLMSGSSVLSPVRGPRTNGIQAVKPEMPVLVIFTMCDKRYTFLHLTRKDGHRNSEGFANYRPVDPNIYINVRSCGCRNPKLRCDRVILESKERNFVIRTFSADKDGDQGLNNWDLSALRLPRSEKFRNAVVNEKVKTLELKFQDVDGRLSMKERPTVD